MIRLITFILIIAFLYQNVVWAAGPGSLMQDNKKILNELVGLLGLDPTMGWELFKDSSAVQSAVIKLTPEEADRLKEFLQENWFNMANWIRGLFLEQFGNEFLKNKIISEFEDKNSHRFRKDLNVEIKVLKDLFGVKSTDELLKFIGERGISLEELYELLNAFSDIDISRKQIIDILNPLYLKDKKFKEKIGELEKKDKRLARLRHLITDYFDKNITEGHIKELTGKQIKFSQLLDEYPYLALQFIINLSREKLAKIGVYHLERHFPSDSKALALAFPELDISDAYFGQKSGIWERLPVSTHVRFVERLLQELERIRQIIIKDKLSEGEIRLIEELKLDKRGKRLLKQLPLLKDKPRLSNLKGEIFHIAIGKIPVHLSEGFFVLYRRLRKKERPDLTFLEYLFQKLGLKDEREISTLELIEEEIRKEFEKGLIQKAYTSSAINIICANLGIEKRGKLKDEVTRLFYTYKFYEILKGIRKRIGEKTKGLKDEEEIRKIRQEELEPLMYTKIKSTHSYLLAGLIKYYKNYKEVFEKNKDKIKEILGFEIDYEKDITGVKYIADIVEWLKGKRKEPPEGSYINIRKGVPYTFVNRKDLIISIYLPRLLDSGSIKYWRSFSQNEDGKNKYLLIWESEEKAKSQDAQPLIRIQLVEDGIILAQKIDGVKTGRKPKVIEKRLIDKVDAISAQKEAEKPKIDINPGDVWLLLYDDLKVAFTVLKVDVENKIIIINNKLLGTKRISFGVFDKINIERKSKGKNISTIKTGQERIPPKEIIKQQIRPLTPPSPQRGEACEARGEGDGKRELFKGGYIDITYEGVKYKAKIEQIEGDNVCINIPGRGMKIFSFAWLKRKYEKNNNLKGVLILPGLPGMLGFITILTLQNNPHLVYIKEIWEYLKIRIEHFKNWLFDNIDFGRRPAFGGADTLFIAALFLAIVGISIILLPPGQTTSSLSELPYLIYPVILMAGIFGKGPREPNPVSKMAAEFSKGNYENAFKLKDSALKYAENDPVALVDIYNILAQIHRVRGGLYRSKCEIYQSDKEYENALNCIERAINIINKTRMGISVLTPAPNVFPPLNNLKSIEKLNEKHIATLFNKGMIYSFIGKHDKAIDIFTDVLQRISGNHKLYQITKAYLGMCYYHINNFNKSEEFLKESIGDTYTPQELVYEFLALIYFYRDKDCKTALEYLKKAYKPENADSDESTKNRIEFWRWMIYLVEGDSQKAMDSLNRALRYQKNVIRSNFVEMGRVFLSASNNKISTVMEYLGYMENKLGKEFTSEFLRSLVTTNAGTLDITDYRDTIMRLFKFQDTTGYIYWLLEEYIGKKIEIEDKGLLTAVIEAVNTLQNEGKENDIEQIKQLDIVRATPQLVYAISGKLKVNEFKGILKTENEVLAEIENAVELYKSKKTKDAHKITVGLIDKLITLPSLHPPEKIKIIVELLHIDGNLLNEPGLEDSFKKIISWMDNMGIDKEILAIANHYLGNLYIDAKVPDKAIEYFKNVTQLSSDPKIKTAANYNLGLIYYDKFKKTTNPEEKEGLTKIVIEFLKEGLYHPYAYIVLAFSYAELEDHVNVLNALVEIRKNQKELEKGGFNIDKMVINSIKNLLHILIKEEDLDEFLCLFKYIGELEDLDILNLFKRFRKLGGNGLIKILFKILDDDSYKVQYKKKLIQLLTGLDLTGSNKELLGILKKQAQKFKEQNISFLFEAIDLINGCLTNDMKDFLLGLEGTPRISNKQNRYKVQIEKISNILDTIDNFFNIQGLIEKGQSYLTLEEWRLSVIDYIPKDQEEWHEYMLERETEKFMIEFNFLRQDVVRNRIIDAYKGNLPIETLRNNLSSLNREMQDKFISDITLIDDSLEKAKELMKNKKWQDAYSLLRVIIEGDINGNKVGCEWYLKNTTLDKTQEIRRKLTLAWQLMDLAYLAFMEPKVYERMRFIIKKWQDKEEEWNTIPQDEILELAKAFYFTWLEKSFIQPIDKNDSYETLLQNSYKVISLFPQEKLKDDLYLMMWYLKIMNIAGAEGFKEKFEELKKIDNPWIIYNIGKFIRERGMPEESLGYYLKALDGIDKEGDKILYENVLSSLMSNMCGLRMHTEVANLVEGKLTGIEDVDLAISGASTLNSVGRHLESLETLQWLINKSMSKELHSEVCLQIGICFYHMERYPEALKWHEKAKELNPLNTRMWNNLSVIYYEKGDINKTIIFMEESLRSGYIINPTSIIEDIIENAVKGKPTSLKFFDALLRECPEVQEIIRKEMKSYGFSIEKTNGNIYIRITFKINQLEKSFTLPINEFKGQYIFCRIKEKIMAHLKTNYPFIIEINGLKAVEDLVYEEIEEQIKSKKLLETSEIEKVLIKASAYALRTEKNLRIPTLLIEETLSLAGPKGKPLDVILDRLQNLTKLGKGENNRIYIAQSNEPPYKEVIVIKLSNNITRKKLAGFIRENEHRIRRFINAFKEDNGEVHIEIEAEDDSVYELAEKIIKNNFLYPQQVMPEIEDFITNDNNAQTENNGGTTLSGTTPDSYIRQGEESEKEFFSQIEKIRKNDITDKYKEKIIQLFESALPVIATSPSVTATSPSVTATSSSVIATSSSVIASEAKQSLTALKENYKIYGFNSIVKGKDDFLLGWNNTKNKELFIAEDVISELEARGPHALSKVEGTTLVDEYLLHEILCPIFGHYPSILIQQKLFPRHYPDEQKLKFQTPQKPYKGLLCNALREIINKKADDILESEAQKIRTYLKDRFKPKVVEEIVSSGLDYIEQGVLKGGATVLQLAEYLAILKKNKLIRPIHRPVRLIYLEGAEFKFRIKDKILGTIPNLIVLAIGHEDMAYEHIKWIHLPRFVKIEISNEEIPDYLVKTIKEGYMEKYKIDKKGKGLMDCVEFNLYKEKENRIYRAILTGDFYVITFYYENFDDFGLSKKLNIRPEEALRLIKSLTGRIHVKIEKGISRRKEINDIITGYIKDNGILQKLDRRFYYVPGKKRSYIHIWCQSMNLYIKMDLQGNVFDSVSEREEIYYPPKKINNISDLTDNINQAIEYYSRNNQTISKRIEQKDKKPLLTSILIWLFITIGLPSSLWAKELFAPSWVLGHLSLSGLLNTISIILVIISALCFTYILYQHLKYRKTNLSRRRFIRNTAIILLGGSILGYIGDKLAQYLLKPISALKRKIIEELNRFALEIKDPESREYANRFIDCFEENGFLTGLAIKNKDLDMKGVIKYNPLEKSAEVNPVVYRLNRISPDTVQASMVHEGAHIEDFEVSGNPFCAKLMALWNYFKNKKFEIEKDNIIENKKWKKFPDTNINAYLFLLLELYLYANIEANAYIAEYNFYYNKFGDLRDYLKDFKIDAYKDYLIRLIYESLKNGKIDKLDEYEFKRIKITAKIWQDITWEDFKKYFSTRMLHMFLELNFSGAIKPDGSVDINKVKRNYIINVAKELKGLRERLLFKYALYIERTRGTVKDVDYKKLTYTVVKPDKFLDWLDTGIFIDRNGNKINLMELDTTIKTEPPKTNSRRDFILLPYMVPSFSLEPLNLLCSLSALFLIKFKDKLKEYIISHIHAPPLLNMIYFYIKNFCKSILNALPSPIKTPLIQYRLSELVKLSDEKLWHGKPKKEYLADDSGQILFYERVFGVDKIKDKHLGALFSALPKEHKGKGNMLANWHCIKKNYTDYMQEKGGKILTGININIRRTLSLRGRRKARTKQSRANKYRIASPLFMGLVRLGGTYFTEDLRINIPYWSIVYFSLLSFLSTLLWTEYYCWLGFKDEIAGYIKLHLHALSVRGIYAGIKDYIQKALLARFLKEVLKSKANFFKGYFFKCVSITETFNCIKDFNSSKPSLGVIIYCNSFCQVFSRYLRLLKSYIKGIYFRIIGNAHISSLLKITDWFRNVVHRNIIPISKEEVKNPVRVKGNFIDGNIFKWEGVTEEEKAKKREEIIDGIISFRNKQNDKEAHEYVKYSMEDIENRMNRLQYSYILNMPLPSALEEMLKDSSKIGNISEDKKRIILKDIESLKTCPDTLGSLLDRTYNILKAIKKESVIGFRDYVEGPNRLSLGAGVIRDNNPYLLYHLGLLEFLVKRQDGLSLIAEYIFHEALELSPLSHQTLRLIAVYLFHGNYYKPILEPVRSKLKDAIREFVDSTFIKDSRFRWLGGLYLELGKMKYGIFIDPRAEKDILTLQQCIVDIANNLFKLNDIFAEIGQLSVGSAANTSLRGAKRRSNPDEIASLTLAMTDEGKPITEETREAVQSLVDKITNDSLKVKEIYPKIKDVIPPLNENSRSYLILLQSLAGKEAFEKGDIDYISDKLKGYIQDIIDTWGIKDIDVNEVIGHIQPMSLKPVVAQLMHLSGLSKEDLNDFRSWLGVKLGVEDILREFANRVFIGTPQNDKSLSERIKDWRNYAFLINSGIDNIFKIPFLIELIFLYCLQLPKETGKAFKVIAFLNEGLDKKSMRVYEVLQIVPLFEIVKENYNKVNIEDIFKGKTLDSKKVTPWVTTLCALYNNLPKDSNPAITGILAYKVGKKISGLYPDQIDKEFYWASRFLWHLESGYSGCEAVEDFRIGNVVYIAQLKVFITKITKAIESTFKEAENLKTGKGKDIVLHGTLPFIPELMGMIGKAWSWLNKGFTQKLQSPVLQSPLLYSIPAYIKTILIWVFLIAVYICIFSITGHIIGNEGLIVIPLGIDGLIEEKKIRNVLNGGIKYLKEKMNGGESLQDRIIWTGMSPINIAKRPTWKDLKEKDLYILVSVGKKAFDEIEWRCKLEDYGDLPLMAIKDAVTNMLLKDNSDMLSKYIERTLERKVDLNNETEWIWIDKFQEGNESGVFRVVVHLKGGEDIRFGIISGKNSGLGSKVVKNDKENLEWIRGLYNKFNQKYNKNLPHEVPEVYFDGYGKCSHNGEIHSIYMFAVEWLENMYGAHPMLDPEGQLLLKGLYRGVPIKHWDIATSWEIRERSIMIATTIFELTNGKLLRMDYPRGDIMANINREGEVAHIYLTAIPYFCDDKDPAIAPIASDRKVIENIHKFIKHHALEEAPLEDRYLLFFHHFFNLSAHIFGIDEKGIPTNFTFPYKLFPEPEIVFSGVTKALIRMYGEKEGSKRAKIIFERVYPEGTPRLSLRGCEQDTARSAGQAAERESAMPIKAWESTQKYKDSQGRGLDYLELTKENYTQLMKKIKDKYPDWEPIKEDVLYDILANGKLPERFPNLVWAMRVDGIIDEEDFGKVSAIGEIIEEVTRDTALNDIERELLTEAISIRYLIRSAGLDKEFIEKLNYDLKSLGYGSKAGRIIAPLSGLKIKLKKDSGRFKVKSHYNFVEKLEALLNYEQKEIFRNIGTSEKKVNLADNRGKKDDSITKYWADIFELNLKQWEVLDLLKDKKPEGIIVQHIEDFGPGIQNWLEGIKRHNIDISGIKMGYIIEGLSEAEIKKLTASKPENVILGNSLEEIKERAQTGNIVYLANENKLNKYKNTGTKLVGKGRAGPVIELSWCLLMLTADDLKNTHKEFLNKMVELKLINEDQVNELEDPYYIILPKVEKVLEMWNEFQEGASYLDIWV